MRLRGPIERPLLLPRLRSRVLSAPKIKMACRRSLHHQRSLALFALSTLLECSGQFVTMWNGYPRAASYSRSESMSALSSSATVEHVIGMNLAPNRRGSFSKS